ncbi:MAG: AI-2E family transporter, partial [Chloroflexi bacterium]|nr:AI-2E family transporter [Chloroflexota bacterium]
MARLPKDVRLAPEMPRAPEARDALDGAATPSGDRQFVVRYQHGLDPRGVFLAVGVLLGGVVLLFILQAIIGPLIFIAITIAVAEALRPPVELLHRRGIGRGPAVLLVYGVIAAIVFLLLSWLLAPFLAQAGALIRDIPTYSGRLQVEINRLQTLMRDQHVPSALSDQIGAFAGRLLHTVIALPQLIFNVFVTGLVMAFLVFFWLTSTPQLKGLLLSITPPRLQKTLLELLAEESRVLGGWLQGSLINMALLGTTMAVVLFLLGVPYALLLGVFAALTQIIPYVGPWI